MELNSSQLTGMKVLANHVDLVIQTVRRHKIALARETRRNEVAPCSSEKGTLYRYPRERKLLRADQAAPVETPFNLLHFATTTRISPKVENLP